MATPRKRPSVPRRVRCGSCGVERELCYSTRRRLARLKKAYICKTCTSTTRPTRVERDGHPHKWCGKCKSYRPVEEFAPLRTHPDGLQFRCRPCMRRSDVEPCACGSLKSAGHTSCRSCWRSPRKTCESCGKEKPLTLYIQQRGTPDGHMASCRNCVNRRLADPGHRYLMDRLESLRDKAHSDARDRCHYERYFSTQRQGGA